ncbi:MAG: tetratricopeptide repeat protein, partial [Planctomycetota bacterium]
MSDADKLTKVGRFSSAEKMLEKITATEAGAKDAEAWAKLAEVRVDMPNPDLDGAEAAIMTALDLVKDKNARYWKILGRISFERGNQALAAQQAANTIKSWFSDAEVKFGESRRLDGSDPEINWLYGWAKELQEYPKKAREAYEKNIAEFPTEAGGYWRRGAQISNDAARAGGRSPEGQKRYGEAVKLFDTGLEKCGPDPRILHLKGIALEWLGKHDEARECYRTAVRSDPTFRKPWDELIRKKESAAKLMDLSRDVLRKHANDGTAAMYLGWVLTGQGETKAAMDVMLPALEVWREHYSLWWQASKTAGPVLMNRATSATAIPWMEKIHEYYEYSADAANNLGLFYRDSRPPQAQKALEWYLKASERAPNSQDILNDTGLIYLFNLPGQEKKSLPYFEKVLA